MRLLRERRSLFTENLMLNSSRIPRNRKVQSVTLRTREANIDALVQLRTAVLDSPPLQSLEDGHTIDFGGSLTKTLDGQNLSSRSAFSSL